MNNLSIRDVDADDAFIPSSEPDDYIHPDEYARVCDQRDEYVRLMCIYVSDMEEAARHLMWTVMHFATIMDAFDRVQLLDAHARLVYPDAVFNEDVARLIEQSNANTLVDISDADTGEVLFERLQLGFVFPDNRHEHARILKDIDRDGFAIIGGDDGPRRCITEWRGPTTRGGPQ